MTPQARLAAALGGEVLGYSTIRVGATLIVAHPSGVVRADGHPVGYWSDPTPVLAAAVQAVRR